MVQRPRLIRREHMLRVEPQQLLEISVDRGDMEGGGLGLQLGVVGKVVGRVWPGEVQGLRLERGAAVDVAVVASMARIKQKSTKNCIIRMIKSWR